LSGLSGNQKSKIAKKTAKKAEKQAEKKEKGEREIKFRLFTKYNLNLLVMSKVVWNPSMIALSKSILSRLRSNSTRNKKVTRKAVEDTVSE
jgi:hypothetical protein